MNLKKTSALVAAVFILLSGIVCVWKFAGLYSSKQHDQLSYLADKQVSLARALVESQVKSSVTALAELATDENSLRLQREMQQVEAPLSEKIRRSTFLAIGYLKFSQETHYFF